MSRPRRRKPGLVDQVDARMDEALANHAVFEGVTEHFIGEQISPFMRRCLRQVYLAGLIEGLGRGGLLDFLTPTDEHEA